MSPAAAPPRSPRGERGEASGELARLVAISGVDHRGDLIIGDHDARLQLLPWTAKSVQIQPG